MSAATMGGYCQAREIGLANRARLRHNLPPFPEAKRAGAARERET
jgi:hypothetical protein